jgi:hypothetical protein
MNQSIYSRCIPELHLTPILDARPEMRLCNNKEYTSQFSGPVSASSIKKTNAANNLVLNLDPKRTDGDCFFCRIIGALSPNKGDALKYLRKIDIDSFVKGLARPYSRAPYEAPNPACMVNNMCSECHILAKYDPIVVHIINRWNVFTTPCYNLPSTTNKQIPYYFNSIYNTKPREFVFNNLTKYVSQYDSRV